MIREDLMNPETQKIEKQALRDEARKRIHLLSPPEIATKSRSICKNVLSTQEYQKAGTIMIYLSLPSEVDTTPIILNAWQRGKTVAVPKVSWQQHRMIPVTLTSLETGLELDKKGIRTPVCFEPVPIDDIDLVIAPGMAFDRNGYRLGRGGGFFDKFFANKLARGFRMALAFNEQIAEDIPHDDHDKRIDCIVTETETIYVRRD